METKTKLLMTFKTDLDKKISIILDDPREDLSEAEIKSAMDLIVSKNIFTINGSNIVSSINAKVVITDTTDYDLVTL